MLLLFDLWILQMAVDQHQEMILCHGVQFGYVVYIYRDVLESGVGIAATSYEYQLGDKILGARRLGQVVQ